uniref:AAA+ ATPase domain-containing protein n=1 Tax=Ditylenchus dipsaci TaxID=166011 RepID=A0A915DUV6_9BILA
MASGIGSYFSSSQAKSSQAKPKPKENQTAETETTVPWVEKYRPKNVNELVYQDEVVAVLKKCIEGADLPNLLFYGPPGTGKTSAAVALCRQLFKTNEAYKDRVLEMNASDERGIDVVRHRIKDFSRRAVSKMQVGSGAFIALKSETHSTRFFLMCNYVTKIIEPLTSRCAKFRFKPLSQEAQKERLLYIAQNESVNLEPDAVDELVSISKGDLRKSITLLQSMACASILLKKEDVRETSGYVPDQLTTAVKVFNRQGYSAYQMICQLADVILANSLLQPTQKAKIFNKMGECEQRLLDGAEEFFNFLISWL